MIADMATDALPPALFSPGFIQNPYPTYQYHQRGPRLQPLPARPGTFLVFGYPECFSLFRDPRTTSVKPTHTFVGSTGDVPAGFESLIDHVQRWLLNIDAPKHTFLRKLMNPAFSPAYVRSCRPKISEMVDKMLDAMDRRGEADIIRDVAHPLPVKVIADMLGIPDEYHGRCIELTNVIAAWFSNVLRSPERAKMAQAAVIELQELFAEVIRPSKGKLEDNLLWPLMVAAKEGTQLTLADVYAQGVMLLFAGHETTRHLIGNGILTFFKSREALEKLRSMPGLIPNAIEEVLRFESPIQAIPRGVQEEIELDGSVIPAGSSLVFMVGAAQRDPRQYANPDEFDIDRKHIRHFGFGGDAHSCLGAALARVETEVVIDAILRRFPNMDMADAQPDWGPNFAIRGLSSLRVRLNNAMTN
jgi:pimeloyl-[acyl-carrier protein] synthase